VTAGICTIVGDATHATAIDQSFAVTDGDIYSITIYHRKNFTVSVGTSRGDNSLLSATTNYTSMDNDLEWVQYDFTASGTTAHLRISVLGTDPAEIDLVNASLRGAVKTAGVQARLLVPPARVTQAWTQRTKLKLQPSGGPMVVGGTVTIAPTGTTPVSITGTSLYVAGGTSAATAAVLDAYGAQTRLVGRRANGTAASPTAVQSGEIITALEARGYGASAYSAAGRAEVRAVAAENWTNTAQGAYLGLFTTATGGTTLTERLRIHARGGVGIGSDLTDDAASALRVYGQTNSLGVRGDGGLFVKTSNNASGAPIVRVQGRRSDGNQSADFSGCLVLEAVRTDTLFTSTKVMGSIIFGGNTDLSETMGYTASITAMADSTWSDTSNAATALVFRTGSTAQALAPNIAYGTDRGRITGNGRWMLGASGPDDGTTTVQAIGTFKATGLATFNAGVDLASAQVMRIGGQTVVKGRMPGWTLPTGTASRATFNTATVTTAELAQCVMALLQDLHSTAGHGLIGA
jgi:hypothetical protein